MKSHELAEKLLKLPNLPVTITRPLGEYTIDYQVAAEPWRDLFDHVRIQVHQPEQTASNHDSLEKK